MTESEYIAELDRRFVVDVEAGTFVRKSNTTGGGIKGHLAGSKTVTGYLVINIFKKIIKSHRLIWLYAHGRWPVGNLDHINLNKTDNRLSNLREISQKQNTENQPLRKNNTSGHPGVSKIGDKWRVRIMHNRKEICLGRFDRFEDAVAARKAGEREYFTHAPKKYRLSEAKK
jgi:hypothetical protein